MKRKELIAYIFFSMAILYCIAIERSHLLGSAPENAVERPLPVFTELIVDIPCQVYVHTRRTGQPQIKGDTALLNRLNLSAENGILYIRLDDPEASHWKNLLFSQWENVTLDIYIPEDKPILAGPSRWLTFNETEEDGLTIHSFGLTSLRIVTDSAMLAKF